MAQIVLARKPQLAEARVADEDWTGKISLQERKKLQNRLNQRAWRRRRIMAVRDGAGALPPPISTMRIHPWPRFGGTLADTYSSASLYDSWSATTHQTSIAKHTDPLSMFGPGQLYSLLSQSLIRVERLDMMRTSPLVRSYSRLADKVNKWLSPLSADSLLTVIHYNNFRGVTINLLIIDALSLDFCEEESVFMPSAEKLLPCDLAPTVLQQMMPHPRWIDMFPIKGVRDNLIRNLGSFDTDDFGADMTGEAPVVVYGSGIDRNYLDACNAHKGWNIEDWESPITAGYACFILWGEPWDADGWEVTPRFLKKWAWVLDGCPEVIQATNKWRSDRGEEPLCFSDFLPSQTE